MVRVLAIEDDILIRCPKLVRVCDLRVAHGKDQIKFWLQHHKPQVIVLDHDMPGFSGMEAVREFWADFLCVPTIIWSHNHEAVKEMKAYLEAQALDNDVEEWTIVVQPFDSTRTPEDYGKFIEWLHNEHQKLETK